MRTIPERRHLDSRAVQRHLKAASTTLITSGEKEIAQEVARQPHRLHKATVADMQDASQHRTNPRHQPGSQKDRLTPAELSHRAAFVAIELPDLGLETHQDDRHVTGAAAGSDADPGSIRSLA